MIQMFLLSTSNVGVSLVSAQGVAMACSWRCPQCQRGLVQCCFNFRISKFKPFHPDSIPTPSRFPCFIPCFIPWTICSICDQPTDFFEIGVDEVKSAVAWSKYVKVTVVKAKTRKNGNHGTTITFVFNYNHWTFFLIMAKNYSGGLGG